MKRNALLLELDEADAQRPLSRRRLQEALLTLAAMSEHRFPRRPTQPVREQHSDDSDEGRDIYKPLDGQNDNDLRLAVLLLERSAKRQRVAAEKAADLQLYAATLNDHQER